MTTLFSDEDSTLARFRFAPDGSFDTASAWLYEGMASAFRGGAARLAIAGENPSLLSAQDPDKVSRANRARSKAYQPALELIAGFDINWTIVSYAAPAWAKAVFPDEPETVAVAKLWEAIFAASRVDRVDPVAAWDEHNKALHARTKLLNDKRYHALHFTGPGTDLTVASPMITSGKVAPRPRRTASSAIRTSPPRRCSRRRTRIASPAPSPAPSRSPTRAR